MSVSSEVPPIVDSQAKARASLSVGPLPDWAVHSPVETAPTAQPGHNFTAVLFERQIDASKRQTCFRQAVRLETMEAVQSQSQWRLSFEPRTQVVILHWIKNRRGATEVEHLNLDKARLLEREAGLEGLVIDGWFTLLLVLEDVRPGDLLDWCYTVEERSNLFGSHCASWFALPIGVPVVQYRFAVKFEESRDLRWKSSNPDVSPTERREDGMVFWQWTGQILNPHKPEPCTPEWHLGFQWWQVSDYPNWGTIATLLANAWKEDANDTTLADLSRDIEQSEEGEEAHIEKALRLVQDEHRYLSVNLELGGHVPTSPGCVARRRYGDCKDLCFLLVNVLRRLGVPARPMLVNTVFRKSVADLLPMPGLFNHVVAELQHKGETRWVDATMRQQGGGPGRRVISNFGFGLPVDSVATELIPQPAISPHLSTYELKEHILLDTSGASSLVAVTVHAQGSHAEALRKQFETTTLSELADERQRAYAKQFGTAIRNGNLQHRYDRDTNEFVIAEVFAIKGFLGQHPTPGFCHFQTPAPLMAKVLVMADEAPRRTPFELPHPCSFTHIIVVESSTLQPMEAPRYDLKNDFIRFSRRIRSGYKSWSMTLSVSTEVDAIAPDRVSSYRKSLEEIWRESIWSLMVPLGVIRPPSRRNFGVLPSGPQKNVNEAKSSSTPFFSPRGKIPDYDLKQKPMADVNTANDQGANASQRMSAKSHGGLVVAGIIVLAVLIVLFALSKL